VETEPSATRRQAIFCRRRHQARRPPPAKIRPGNPAPTMGPGTGEGGGRVGTEGMVDGGVSGVANTDPKLTLYVIPSEVSWNMPPVSDRTCNGLSPNWGKRTNPPTPIPPYTSWPNVTTNSVIDTPGKREVARIIIASLGGQH